MAQTRPHQNPRTGNLVVVAILAGIALIGYKLFGKKAKAAEPAPVPKCPEGQIWSVMAGQCIPKPPPEPELGPEVYFGKIGKAVTLRVGDVHSLTLPRRNGYNWKAWFDMKVLYMQTELDGAQKFQIRGVAPGQSEIQFNYSAQGTVEVIGVYRLPVTVVA